MIYIYICGVMYPFSSVPVLFVECSRDDSWFMGPFSSNSVLYLFHCLGDGIIMGLLVHSVLFQFCLLTVQGMIYGVIGFSSCSVCCCCCCCFVC